MLGEFSSLSATTAIRHPLVSLVGTDEILEATTPDHIAIQGILQSGALVSMHFRAGAGLQVDSSASAGNSPVNFFWEIEGENGLIVLKGPAGHVQVGASYPCLYVED